MAGRFSIIGQQTQPAGIPSSSRIPDPLETRAKELQVDILKENLLTAQQRNEAQESRSRGKPTNYRRLTTTRNRRAALDILNGIYGGDPVLQAFLTAIKHTR